MIFKFFDEITKIPRPSGKEEQIMQYLIDFAKTRGLECIADEARNVIIKKPASPGCTSEPVILQSHTDMVCEHEAGLDIDMETTGITTVIEGDWMRARGTTLGSDDGIGMAMMLALLDSSDITHPPLECVFTATEETGMNGAKAIDLSVLKGRRMINLDSEDEGILTTGCAGGGRFTATYRLNKMPSGTEIYKIKVEGFTGGHSGTDIIRYRANATLMLVRLLRKAEEHSLLYIESIEGGSKDNAIPRSAFATIGFSEPKAALDAINREFECIRHEFAATDPNASISIENQGGRLSYTVTNPVLALGLISALPNGIQSMSHSLEGIPETSLNLGVTVLEKGILTLTYALRSSVESAFEDLKSRMKLICESFNASYQIHSEYPGWEPAKDSPVCAVAFNSYKKLYGKEPIIDVIHAGLECGLLKKKLPELDIVSIGPDIRDAHSPSEKLSIPSTKRVWAQLCDMLAEM